MSTRAAVLTQLNAPLEVMELEPLPLMAGEVLVKIICTGICGAQLLEIKGEKGNADYLPHCLGHEAVGRVIQSRSSHIPEGVKVIAHWRKSIGSDQKRVLYTSSNGTVGAGSIATFADVAVINETRLTEVTEDMPDELCCLLGCALSTALCVVQNVAKVKPGESVLVIGCGGVGMCCMKAAKIFGAFNISGYDNKKKSHLLPREATSMFSGPPDGCRWPVIIDTTGCGLELALNHIAPSGRIILVGQGEQTVTIGKGMFAGEGISIIATQAGGFRPSEDIPRFVQMWRAGLLNDDGIVTHRYTLSQINQGIDMLKSGNAGRVLVYPNGMP